MKEITEEMYKTYRCESLGIDMMGYSFRRKGELSYHHLIIPKRFGGKETFENGAILTNSPLSSSHGYLHTIERYDPEMFALITSELIDETILRRIELTNLRYIHSMLESFEREYSGKTTRKGNCIIRPEFVEPRINPDNIRVR